MSNNTVFRLEMADGKGIFQSYKNEPSIWTQCSDGYKNIEKHPTLAFDSELQLVEEELGNKIKDYFFAFSSLNQYKKWMFNPLWRKRLSVMKVQLNEYEVEDGFLFKSEFQALFKKEFSVLIKTHDPKLD